MMNHRPMFFFACNDCGGETPPSATDITQSTKYAALATGNALRLLGVAVGATQQAFLGGTTLPGFVWINSDGVAIVNVAPELTLPDATSGAFTRLLVGTADSPSKWQMFVAPATGNYTLVSMNGQYSLVGFGAIPLDTLGPLGSFADELILAGIQDLGSAVWSTNKLTAPAQRALVGRAGNKVGALPMDEYLVHPLIQAGAFRTTTYIQMDGSGVEETGGLAVGTALTTNVLCIYNTAAKKFYQAPARVRSHVTATTTGGDVHVGEGVSWVPLSPHCILETTHNYPNCYVDAYIRAQITNGGADPDDYTMDFAIFVDDVKVKEFNIEGSKDNNISYILTGLTLGSRKIDIRARKAVVADQTMRIVVSDMSVFSLV